MKLLVVALAYLLSGCAALSSLGLNSMAGGALTANLTPSILSMFGSPCKAPAIPTQFTECKGGNAQACFDTLVALVGYQSTVCPAK